MKTALLLLFVLSVAACGFDERQHTKALNGARCNSADECVSGMSCEVTPHYPWSVCTGALSENESCSSDVQCRYALNDKGLPLRCIGGRCTYENRVLDIDATPSN